MKILIEKQWIKKYASLERKIEEVVPEAISNLEKIKRMNIIPTISKDRCIEVEFMDLNIDTTRFNREDIKLNDIVNFALARYYDICRNNIIKNKIFDIINEPILIEIVKKLGLDQETDRIDYEKNRYFIYTLCPICEQERVYFCMDFIKKNIFVGCFNEQCSIHYKKCADMVGFLEQWFNKEYPEALAMLAEMCGVDIKTPPTFQDTTYFVDRSIDYLKKYGFNEDVINECNIVLGQANANPVIYKNKGLDNKVYVITNRVMDAMRIRKYNKDVSVFAVFNNTLSENQMDEINADIPKSAEIVLAFDTNIPDEAIEIEINRLKQQGFYNIKVANIPDKYTNFYEIKNDNALVEGMAVHIALKARSVN